jgi:hypothetical protein
LSRGGNGGFSVYPHHLQGLIELTVKIAANSLRTPHRAGARKPGIGSDLCQDQQASSNGCASGDGQTMDYGEEPPTRQVLMPSWFGDNRDFWQYPCRIGRRWHVRQVRQSHGRQLVSFLW